MTIKKSILLLLTIALFSFGPTKNNKAPWIHLIDGNTLNGWTILGGNATYKVENGVVIGTTAANTSNTFLTTNNHYGDFILELDYKVNPSMNSGIQIRSNSLPTYRNGNVHGYQVEIDPSKCAWSGGIYDEQRRGWLNPLTDTPKAQKAFKQNEWNHFRIEAIGDTIKTWINKAPAAYLIDNKTASGFIGLQVHSIPKDKKAGTQIRWKNIKIITDNPVKYSRKSSLTPIDTKNNLTIKEPKTCHFV